MSVIYSNVPGFLMVYVLKTPMVVNNFHFVELYTNGDKMHSYIFQRGKSVQKFKNQKDSCIYNSNTKRQKKWGEKVFKPVS